MIEICGATIDRLPELQELLRLAETEFYRPWMVKHHDPASEQVLRTGLGGLWLLRQMGIDGVISTRSGVIAAAKKLGVTCIQRFFMVDSRSVDTALDSIRHLSPDMIEIMPAIAYKSISHIRNHTRIPIIAGGLIDSKDEIFSALGAGATMVSTGRHELWSV